MTDWAEFQTECVETRLTGTDQSKLLADVMEAFELLRAFRTKPVTDWEEKRARIIRSQTLPFSPMSELSPILSSHPDLVPGCHFWYRERRDPLLGSA